MKISTIRKAFIKQSLIILGIITVVSSVVFYVDMIDGEYIQNSVNQKAQADLIAKQVADLSTEYAGVNSSTDIYNEINLKKEKKMLTVSKQLLKDTITSVKDKYYFDNVKVKMDELKTRSEDKFKKEKIVVESSNVNIELDSLSDIDVFGLIDSIQSSFSSARLLNLKLTAKDINSVNLLAIKEKGFLPLVSAKITLSLSGFREINDKSIEPLLEETDKQNKPNFEPRIRLRNSLK